MAAGPRLELAFPWLRALAEGLAMLGRGDWLDLVPPEVRIHQRR